MPWRSAFPQVLMVLVLSASATFAQNPPTNLPATIDPGRVQTQQRPAIANQPPPELMIPKMPAGIKVPAGAQQVTLTLNGIRIKGATAFSETELASIYESYVGQQITLDMIWMIAGQITERYQNAGYFLSRASVPAQEIDGGVATIEVFEGFVACLILEDPELRKNPIIQRLIRRIRSKRPLSAYDLESFMLQLNALPGVEFRAFLEPMEGGLPGCVKLTLRPAEEGGQGSISLNNFGSRFLGPYQANVTYRDSFIPLQQTSVSVLGSMPTDELNYLSVRHLVPVYPDWNIELSTNYIAAEPGASLAPNQIESASIDIGVGVQWQPIRQRRENLVVSAELTGKNTNADILTGNPLTRDRIRVARGLLRYDTDDGWNGYNYVTFGVNFGLKALGASRAGDRNLSRAEAEPDFTTGQFSYTRQQMISRSFMAVGQFSAQIASGPLFSAEEFGYGGQSFGRSYDPSEVSGDHGVSASLELRYLGISPRDDISYVPYTFYDVGRTWNEDTGGVRESAASAGLGLLVSHASGLQGNIGLAWPLTRPLGEPIYGNGKNPRLLLQLSRGF